MAESVAAWITRACSTPGHTVTEVVIHARRRDVTGHESDTKIDVFPAAAVTPDELASRIEERLQAEQLARSGAETVYLLEAVGEGSFRSTLPIKLGTPVARNDDPYIRLVDAQERLVGDATSHAQAFFVSHQKSTEGTISFLMQLANGLAGRLNDSHDARDKMQQEIAGLLRTLAGNELEKLKLERGWSEKDLSNKMLGELWNLVLSYGRGGPGGQWQEADMHRALREAFDRMTPAQIEQLGTSIQQAIPEGPREKVQAMLMPFVDEQRQKRSNGYVPPTTGTTAAGAATMAPASTNGHAPPALPAPNASPEQVNAAALAALTLPPERVAELDAWYEKLTPEQREALQPVIDAYARVRRTQEEKEKGS